jgi:uncharacterized RDD family membrane protein YckC
MVREDYTLLTPENVVLQYEVAGLGSRLAAATIDYLILVIAWAILTFAGFFLVGLITAGSGLIPATANDAGFAASRLVAFGILAFITLVTFFFWWGYFVLTEMIWNGQSIGKRRLRLRVVRAGGQPISLGASLVRNLLRIVDLFLMLGVLVMLIDRSSRRLGDFAAGTLVIREAPTPGKSDLGRAFGDASVPAVPEAQVAALSNAGRLTAEHYALLRDFFARRPRLSPDAAESLARRLALEFGELLEVPLAEIGDPASFLATAVRAYEARHRYDDSG